MYESLLALKDCNFVVLSTEDPTLVVRISEMRRSLTSCDDGGSEIAQGKRRHQKWHSSSLNRRRRHRLCFRWNPRSHRPDMIRFLFCCVCCPTAETDDACSGSHTDSDEQSIYTDPAGRRGRQCRISYQWVRCGRVAGGASDRESERGTRVYMSSVE